MKIGLLIALLFCLCCTLAAPAQAAGPGLFDLSQFSLSTLAWIPFNSDRGDTVISEGIAWSPFADPKAPKTPTNAQEIIPWAVANLSLVAPVDITGDNRGNIRGAGFTETAQIAVVSDAPISVGIGWHADRDWCWLASLNIPF
jgi:hypothetical protein